MRQLYVHLLGLLLLHLPGQVGAQQPEPPKYKLKVDAGVLRARFGPAETVSGAIPFNRSYAELTPAQKALVRAEYVDMSADDEPPFPEGGLGTLFEPLTAAQTHLGAEGTVFVEVIVGSDGSPVEAKVYQAPSKKVGSAVASIAMLTRFKPARCAGQPCRMGFPIRLEYKVR